MSAQALISEHESLSAQLPGNDVAWLQQLRRDAAEQFNSLGLPTRRHEDWKYTDVQPIAKRDFAVVADVEVTLDDLKPYLFEGLDCDRMVFVNGRYQSSLSHIETLPEGAVAQSLAEVLGSGADGLQDALGQMASVSANGFAALNAAFVGDGAFVSLQAGVALQRPLHLLFVSVGSKEQASLAQPRNLILAAENSSAVVIENYITLGEGGGLTNVVTEADLQASAQLTHYKLQQSADNDYHIGTLQVKQAEDSKLVSHAVNLSGRISRHDINTALQAENASCVLNGLYMVDGRQHVDFHTRVDHIAPHCESDETYKGILDGHGRAVFNGQAHVHPGAQKTEAHQSNRNLLLSRTAEIDTKPQLEIYADDVACSHGATVGQLDNTMLFYLRSRGIAAEQARAMLTYGFAHDIVERMDLEPVKAYLEQVLFNRLPDAV